MYSVGGSIKAFRLELRVLSLLTPITLRIKRRVIEWVSIEEV